MGLKGELTHSSIFTNGGLITDSIADYETTSPNNTFYL